MNNPELPAPKLPTPLHLFITLLVTICTVEILVHFCMPSVIPDTLKHLQGIADALLLVFIISPFVWVLIARPMRSLAMAEISRTKAVLESVVEAVICFNAEGTIVSLNPAAEKMFGFPRGEILGRPMLRIIPAMIGDPRSKAMGQSCLPPIEMVGQKKDGTSFPVEVSLSDLLMGGRQILIAIIHDISERKLAEAALEEQKAFSLRLVQDSAVPCFVLAPDHRVLVWNKAFEELSGIKSDDVIGSDGQWRAFFDQKRPTLADMVLDGRNPQLDGSHPDCVKSAFAEGGLQSEGWYPNIGGKERYLFFDAVPVRNGKGEMIAVIETLEDITERKTAADSLKKSEEKFFKAFHASPDGIVINTKADGFFIEANDAFFRILGYAREEVIGHSSLELGIWVDPAERSRIIEQTDQEGAVRNIEIRIRVKSGAVRTFLWSSDEIDLNGKECLIVIVRDITPQKENERQLLKSKAELTVKHEQLSALFSQVESVKREWEKTMDCINDMVFLLDRQGRVKRCNRAALEFAGINYGEIVGHDWRRLMESSGAPAADSAAWDHACEFHHEKSNRWLFLTYYHDRENAEHENAGAVVTIHDITATKQASLELAQAYADLKKTQNQMIQHEKMASIGQLAAGVAHEINNPTGYMISNLESMAKYKDRLVDFINAQDGAIHALGPSEQEKFAVLRKKMKIDRIIDDLPHLISESLEGADRIKNIVHSLKGLSRKDDTECKLASIADCLDSTINIIWNEVKYKASLKKEYGDLPQIKCHPQQLSQVFMNLIVNAAHAIEEQGEITVKTWQENGKACIAIRDTGSGIPEEIRSRIFEPFFTTKEVGKGTGLGLSISYDIVRKHGGDMAIESMVGVGTTFIVTLPLEGMQAA